jgi:hypothetical protein
MDYSLILCINAIIWFFGTLTLTVESSWTRPTFLVLLVLSIVMNVALLVTKKYADKRGKTILIVYTVLSSLYLILDFFFV